MHRGSQDDARLFLARELGEDGVHPECRDGGIAARAMLLAELGEHEAQVVRDLGHRGHGRVHAGARRALLERDGGWNAGHAIDVGARHGGEKLARVGCQCFEKTPLPFGEHDVEGERALAGTARPGDDAELPARQLARNLAQVVLARVLHDDAVVALHRGAAFGARSWHLDAAQRPRRGARSARDLGGRPSGHHRSPLFAAGGAEIDDPIGGPHHGQIVLHGDHRGPRLHERVQRFDQPIDVGGVKPGARLVEDEQCPGLVLGERARELHALRFAPRQRRERLPEREITEPERRERPQGARDRRIPRKMREHLVHCALERLRDRPTAVANGEHLGLKTPPLARRANQRYVGEKLHFHRLVPFAVARLAAAAGDVEREVRRREIVGPRVGLGGEAVAQMVPSLGVRRGIAARGSTEGRLIDERHLGHPAGTFDRVVRAGRFDVAHPFRTRERSVNHDFGECALAGTARPGDRRENAEGDVDVDALQVVGARPLHAEPRARAASLARFAVL